LRGSVFLMTDQAHCPNLLNASCFNSFWNGGASKARPALRQIL
jgi:hypothetical protein